jgi:glutathione S-transferase
MKLYDYPKAPNPRRVNIFLAEKNIEVERITVNLMEQEQLQDWYRAKNPACDVPMLELDDGTCISQIRGVTHYFEDVYPDIPMYGKTAAEKGLTEMWEHLAAMNGLMAVAEAFRNTTKGMVNRGLAGPHNYAQSPELAQRGVLRLANFFHDFDHQLGKNEYVAGDFYSMADITTLVTCDFAKWIKAEIPEDCANLRDWYTRVSARPAVIANP